MTPVAGLWKSCLKQKLTFPTQAKPSKPSKANPRYRKWLEHESWHTRFCCVFNTNLKTTDPTKLGKPTHKDDQQKVFGRAQMTTSAFAIFKCLIIKVSASRARNVTLLDGFDLTPHSQSTAGGLGRASQQQKRIWPHSGTLFVLASGMDLAGSSF